jgi:hypothetical protein
MVIRFSRFNIAGKLSKYRPRQPARVVKLRQIISISTMVRNAHKFAAKSAKSFSNWRNVIALPRNIGARIATPRCFVGNGAF